MYRTIAHTVLALFLLVATTGITINMHYCGGNLVSTSINTEAKSCCDDYGCCENKNLHYELENDYVASILFENNNNIVELEVLFPMLFVMDFHLSPSQAKATFAFIDFYPPPKIQIRLSLLQTYLI